MRELNIMMVHAGATSSLSCNLCQAGTYGTGSGEGLRVRLGFDSDPHVIHASLSPMCAGEFSRVRLSARAEELSSTGRTMCGGMRVARLGDPFISETHTISSVKLFFFLRFRPMVTSAHARAQHHDGACRRDLESQLQPVPGWDLWDWIR